MESSQLGSIAMTIDTELDRRVESSSSQRIFQSQRARARIVKYEG